MTRIPAMLRLMAVPAAVMIVMPMSMLLMMVTEMAVRMFFVDPCCGSHRGRSVFVQLELRCRNACPQHTFGRNGSVLDCQATERGTKPVNREPQIEQRSEEHVAGGTRETIEIRESRH